MTCGTCDNEGFNNSLWSSQRGMLLVLAMFFYMLMVALQAYTGKVGNESLLVFGAFIAAGGAYYFKSKGDEALAAANK